MATQKIVALCGSLRRGSLNRAALQAAMGCMPEGMSASILEWSDVPPFNADAVTEHGFPTCVTDLCNRIREADGVLIATPEYNFSLPGMFKNAIDWISRVDDQPFAKKAVAIMSASAGPLGGARVQYEARRVMLYLDANVLQKPEVFIGGAASKFAADGRCTDDVTLKFLSTQMAAFSSLVQASQRG